MEFGVLFVFLFIRLILAFVASAIASSKGRSRAGWFFGGLLFDIWAIILVAVLPNLKDERRRKAQDDMEHRRLREQLRQERIKNEALRQHVAARLDTHDNLLGVDTRAETPLLDAPGAAGSAAQLAGEPAEPVSGPRWYYARDGQTRGPYSADQMEDMRRNGVVDKACWVMPVGGQDWIPLSDVDTFFQV